MFGEGLPQDVHDGIALEALQRRDLGAVGGHREGDARPRGRAVDQHGARAADAVLAADMGRRQELMLAQEIREVQPRLDLGLDVATVDDEGKWLSRRARLFGRALQGDEREASDVFVRHVLPVEQLQHRLSIEAFGKVGTEAAAEQRRSRPATTIGAVSMAPITARNVPRAGS